MQLHRMIGIDLYRCEPRQSVRPGGIQFRGIAEAVAGLLPYVMLRRHPVHPAYPVLFVMSLERRPRDRVSHCNELPISPT